MKNEITVSALIHSPVEKVWECWTDPGHITKWCHASDDWCAPRATNDLRVGGAFTTRMESTDGADGFDFEGTYTVVEKYKRIEYAITGGRTVKITFEAIGDTCKVTETVEAENENPLEMQKAGWQAILDNFKKYTEQNTVA
jgi:uncharacterized protein YndB with AHSA1/START domain